MSVEDINDSDALFGDEGLGLDSVDSIELVLIIEKEYGVKIQNPELYNEIFSSVENLLKYINENLK
jgi:acyl carrier protein